MATHQRRHFDGFATDSQVNPEPIVHECAGRWQVCRKLIECCRSAVNSLSVLAAVTKLNPIEPIRHVGRPVLQLDLHQPPVAPSVGAAKRPEAHL